MLHFAPKQCKKGVRRQHMTLVPRVKMLFVPMTFFSLADYALEG